MKLSKNFSLEELIKSDTANECGIKNSPNSLELKNLTNLTTKILQPIRDAFGKPIIISSGFRCVQLNKKVGGASNSDHLFGAAADTKYIKRISSLLIRFLFALLVSILLHR